MFFPSIPITRTSIQAIQCATLSKFSQTVRPSTRDTLDPNLPLEQLLDNVSTASSLSSASGRSKSKKGGKFVCGCDFITNMQSLQLQLHKRI